MTRDAKIGLLLGLAFIFVIAFILNGLPNFREDKKSSEFTAVSLTNMRRNSPVIGEIEREYINDPPNRNHPLLQSEGPLMGNPSSLQKSDTFKTIEIDRINVKSPEVKEPMIVKTVRPQVYVVKDGDNLSKIAIQFYGPEEGNKIVVITALFKANNMVLKSPDNIYVGQKLIIPPLSALMEDRETSSSGIDSSIFENIESIRPERLPSKKPERASRGKSYTVREGDNLWKIATDQLGNGSRYPEIVKLNDDVLSDEDSLTVGMTLKMPSR